MKKQSLYEDRAELYDKIYAWKNYHAESDKLCALLSAEGIGEGSRVLEAACGTGNYLTVLASHYRVSGFDKSEAMLAVARRKLPDAHLFAADMRSFEIAEPFDAALCLFSSIGYLKTDDEIASAARAFARAVRPGGVIVVEPWLNPAAFVAGTPLMQTCDEPDLKICRQCVTRVDRDLSITEMHWLIARRSDKVEYFVEDHELRLIEPRALVQIFSSAGLSARFEPDGLMPDRGLLFAHRR
jgi:ubiquinone/menaquinone biosynthesis C-methylase UbiE